MRRARLRRFILVALLVFSVGCALFYKQPRIEFGGVRLGEIGGGRVDLEVSAEIANPNRFRLGLKSLSYRLRVNGIEAASGTTESELVIPPHGSAALVVPVSIDWARVKEAGWEVLSAGRLDYSVEGEAVFSTPLGTFRRKFNRSSGSR